MNSLNALLPKVLKIYSLYWASLHSFAVRTDPPSLLENAFATQSRKSNRIMHFLVTFDTVLT